MVRVLVVVGRRVGVVMMVRVVVVTVGRRSLGVTKAVGLVHELRALEPEV
jgi:hypothetical protein